MMTFQSMTKSISLMAATLRAQVEMGLERGLAQPQEVNDLSPNACLSEQGEASDLLTAFSGRMTRSGYGSLDVGGSPNDDDEPTVPQEHYFFP